MIVEGANENKNRERLMTANARGCVLALALRAYSADLRRKKKRLSTDYVEGKICRQPEADDADFYSDTMKIWKRTHGTRTILLTAILIQN